MMLEQRGTPRRLEKGFKDEEEERGGIIKEDLNKGRTMDKDVTDSQEQERTNLLKEEEKEE